MIDYFEIATSACGLLAMTIPNLWFIPPQADLRYWLRQETANLRYLLLGLRFFTASFDFPFGGVYPERSRTGSGLKALLSSERQFLIDFSAPLEMTVGSGRFQRLQVRFYVETRCYNSILGVLYHKLWDFSREFCERKRAKTGIDLNEQAW